MSISKLAKKCENCDFKNACGKKQLVALAQAEAKREVTIDVKMDNSTTANIKREITKQINRATQLKCNL